MTGLNHDQQLVLYTSIEEGIDKHVSTDIELGGVVFTPAALKSVFGAAVDAIKATEAQLEKYRAAVARQHAAQQTADSVALRLRGSLVARFGDQAFEVLGDFGFDTPKPKGPKTVAAKAKGIAARDLTRQARHTMGSQQEKQVNGQIEVPFNSPVLAGQGTPAAAPAPAAAPLRPEVKPQS